MKMRRDARLELRQLASVTPLDHLPNLVQPRDERGLLVRNTQFHKLALGPELRANFREQRRDAFAGRRGNGDGVWKFFLQPVQRAAACAGTSNSAGPFC